MFDLNIILNFLHTDVKKVCPTEMPLRRRVSIDSSRGMSEDSSEDEDSRNQNIANSLKNNRSVISNDQLTVNFYYSLFT